MHSIWDLKTRDGLIKKALEKYPDIDVGDCFIVGDSLCDVELGKRRKLTMKQVTKIFNDVKLNDYSCVILPEIINLLPALYDNRLISFLSRLNNREIL